MQNKPNFQDAQMNVNIYYTKVYKNETAFRRRKNKPNSNPIKPNLRKAKMNVKSLITKDYRKYGDFVVQKNKPNSNPISVKPKMSANVFVTKDYENETTHRPQKNKPNQTQFQNLTPKEREGKKPPGKLLKKQFYFFMSQNELNLHYIARTRILKNFLRC